MSLVVRPEGAQKEVKRPAVQWDGENSPGAHAWQGKVTGSVGQPQVELRKKTHDGANVVVYLSVRNRIEKKGKNYNAGVMLAMNKSVLFRWEEYYTLEVAIEEAVERLVAIQEGLLTQLGEKLVNG